MEEDSLRATIGASLSLAHSRPKDSRLLPMPKRQSYRRVNRFIKRTAVLTAEDRARAVRRACDLAVKKGQVAAGIFSSGQRQSAVGNSRGLFAAYRETHSQFSITMQEDPAASWAKANSADVRAFNPQKLAERASEKAHLAANAKELDRRAKAEKVDNIKVLETPRSAGKNGIDLHFAVLYSNFLDRIKAASCLT